MITKSKNGIYEPKAYETTIDYTITKSPLFSVLGHMWIMFETYVI